MTARLPTTPTVLVARSPERAAGLIDRLGRTGVTAVSGPVVERAPVEDPAHVAELADARAALARGEYAWVALTSVNAVDALLDGPGRSGLAEARTLWACVGPATRRAIERHGLTVALVPADRMTAAALVRAFPAFPAGDRTSTDRDGVVDGPGTSEGPLPGRRVLVPLGDLAAPTLPEGLRAKGWEPHVVTAYRTVARDLARDVVEHASTTGYDVVVVASGSAARQVAAQLGPQRVVAIGEPSARAAREAGHEVVAVAARPTDDALATAVVHALDLSA
ncbi:uroporphyrinogen-III synthase [Myceligenerans indicum]|uniref:Uroporphyrinogen-III synthase n=1 Tax=Myceligenerans indicum TaxID=2593663 RepID=A0ABS1LP27_9MICO|nr:uroporphyrinogen-III synthase [Myceligenerans indicum]MBL0887312.1 uroporphyrinogen-III synthase [Myceligenerans indicum]